METKREVFKIGTRGSALALWQAETVSSLLKSATEIVKIRTSGDIFLEITLQGQSQTGFFTKEIENQLKTGKIDIAVHSLKDLPTQPHPELELSAYLPRASAGDLLIINPEWFDPKNIIPVKRGCRVGATSLRRQSLLRLYGPQAVPEMLRGNVPTRIDKCRDGQYGAIIVAAAGVERLRINLSPLIVYRLAPEIWLPAPGQGVVAVQNRKNDKEVMNFTADLNDEISREAVMIERKLLEIFEGGCHTAFGAYAFHENGYWNVHFGLDRGDKTGWGQMSMSISDFDEIMNITPSEAKSFHQIEVNEPSDLCKQIQL